MPSDDRQGKWQGGLDRAVKAVTDRGLINLIPKPTSSQHQYRKISCLKEQALELKPSFSEALKP